MESSRVANRLFDEAWRNRDGDVLDEICAPECVFYDVTQGERGVGLSAYKETMRRFDDAFRLLDFSWEPVAETEDTFVCRWQMRARMEGPFAGRPPTGREGEATGVAIVTLKDGKITEQRSVWNALAFFEQLGLVEWRGAGAEAEGPGANI